jgi:thiol:disulfide interchange protein DsbD
MFISRYLNILIVIIFQASVIFAQQSPVKWTFETKRKDSKSLEITATAIMEKDWVIYSQYTEEGGPIATSFTIDGEEIKFLEDKKPTVQYDELFMVNVSKFKKTASFTYITEKDLINKNATVTYMTCDGSKCLPPKTLEFIISISQ